MPKIAAAAIACPRRPTRQAPVVAGGAACPSGGAARPVRTASNAAMPKPAMTIAASVRSTCILIVNAGKRRRKVMSRRRKTMARDGHVWSADGNAGRLLAPMPMAPAPLAARTRAWPMASPTAKAGHEYRPAITVDQGGWFGGVGYGMGDGGGGGGGGGGMTLTLAQPDAANGYAPGPMGAWGATNQVGQWRAEAFAPKASNMASSSRAFRAATISQATADGRKVHWTFR